MCATVPVSRSENNSRVVSFLLLEFQGRSQPQTWWQVPYQPGNVFFKNLTIQSICNSSGAIVKDEFPSSFVVVPSRY